MDGSLPAHLDLLETAIYMTSEPDLVLVEFTTRGPIHPIPRMRLPKGDFSCNSSSLNPIPLTGTFPG